jgi:hypothetical protein
MRTILLATLALGLFACFKDDTADTGPDSDADTDTDTDIDMGFDTVGTSYTATDWTYTAELTGWADAVTLYITQDTSSPWEEDHELVNTAYGKDGSWDLYELTLPITDDWEKQEPNVNTLFGNSISCENPYCETTMAWQFKAWEGKAVADCVVFAGSAADVSIVMEEGCREITPE